MRVLTTWQRWGVLYFFFKRYPSRRQGWRVWEGIQQDSQGQNRRYADFGTVVESCSKKLPLSSAALVCGYTGLLHQYSDCGGVLRPRNGEKGSFWQTQRKFFCFPCLLPTTIWRYGLPKIFENGRKKSSKPFQDLLLIAVMGGGIKLSAVFKWNLSAI